jgi:hypothetical protein
MNYTHIPYYEDDFPLEFDTGFTLFVTAVCIVAFLYAVWVAMYTKIIGCGLCAFVAAASAVCATWGGTARTKEVNSWGNWTAIGFGVFVFIWSYILMISFVNEKREQRSQRDLESDVPHQVAYFYLNVSAIATLLALIPGMVVLAVYCKRMEEVEQYEYYGPMYISGYQTELYNWYDGGACRFFHGQLNVSWGMEWGCPDYIDRWCSDVATDHDCTKDLCHYPAYDSAPSESGNDNDDECGEKEACTDGRQAAEQCIIDKYELFDWLDELQSDNHNYNRNETPDEATTAWPQAIMYGNCDTCKAKVEVPLESAQDLKPIGIGLTLGGLVTDALLVCVLLLSRTGLCKKTRQVYQTKPSTTSFKDGKTPIVHIRV